VNPSSYQTIARWLLFKQPLNALFDHLEAQNIEFLVLKGWAFMGDIYTNPSQRFISDVDILLHPQDLNKVVSILQEFGFTCFLGSQHLANLGSASDNQIPLELSFINSQEVNIDLHTHIMPSDWTLPAYNIDMRAIWQGSRPFTDWTGRELNRLGFEHTFLHLCTHIMRHDLGIQSPQSFRDLDLWVRKYQSEINWDEIIKLSNQWGLNTALCFITSYSSILLQTPFPQEFSTSLKFSLNRQKWIRKIIPLSVVRTSQKLSWWRVILAKILVIDHPIKILKHLLNSLFPSHQYRQSIHGSKISLVHHWKTILQKISS
jgi:hypothetical protein